MWIGVNTFPAVGIEELSVFRSMVLFDLESLRGETILEARLRLSIVFATEGCDAGCGTVHALTSDWGEGGGFFDNVTMGGSSWEHSRFPVTWDSPGGDFVAEPIGVRSFEESDFHFVNYDLNVADIQAMADGDNDNYGFLIKNDNEVGYARFETLACASSTSSSCPRNFAPSLDVTLAPPPGSPTPSPTAIPVGSRIVTVNASMDNEIFHSESNETYQYWNAARSSLISIGRATSPSVGVTSVATWRVLLFFDLSGLGGEKILRADLILSVFERSSFCLNGNAGCGRVHVMSTPWQSGNKFFENATEGDSSWLFSNYPMRWTNPGGDYFEGVVGMEQSNLTTDESAVFPLNVAMLQAMVDDESRNLGFLIRADESDNAGFLAFESLGCFEFDSCPRQQVPRLQLEVAGATAVPTSSPTLAPPPSPTGLPTGLPTGTPTRRPLEDGDLFSHCGTFTQSLTVVAPSLASISVRSSCSGTTVSVSYSSVST